MADKVIAIKVDVQGTTEQQKKLAKLETEVKKLTNRRTELNKAVKAGTISLEKYGKEIAKVNTKLKANRRQMLVLRENILGLDSFTKKLGKSFSRLGTSVGAAFVGLFAIQKIGQLFSSAIDTIKEFEQQMANVKAITGATEEEFQKLEKSAKELGATTQFTAKEVGQLQEEYAKLGFTTDQILDASEATLELATATGSDLAQSAKVAAGVINGFGLEAKDTQKIVDVMAKSFTSSALDITKFETAMRQVAPVAKTVGLSVEETTAALGVLVDSGIRAETAGTGLRNILLETKKAGISVEDAFNKITTSLDPSKTALELFGKENSAVAITLADSTRKTARFTKELENSNGAASAMAKIVGDTLEGDVKRLNSAWEGLVLNLGQNGEGLFREITQGVTDLIGGISDLVKNTHEQSDAMETQRVKMNALVQGITDVNTGEEERSKLINELNARYPKFLGNLDAEKVTNEQLRNRLKEVNDELVNKIIIQRENEKIEEAGEQLAEDRIDRAEEDIELRRRLNRLNTELNLGLDLLNGTLEDNVQATQKAIIATADNGLEKTAAIALAAQLGLEYGSLKDAQDDVTESTDELNKAQKDKNELLKSLGINESDYTDKVDENTEAVNANNDATAKSVKNLNLINKELEEIDDDDFFWNDEELDKQEVFFDESENSFKKFADAVEKINKGISDVTEKEADDRAKEFASEAREKLDAEIEAENQRLEFKKEVRKQELDLAEQAASALIDVSNRRVERQKTLELASLDARLEQGLISQADFEKEREAIERRAFNKQKRLEIAQIQISLARELASIAANSAGNPLNAFTGGTAGAVQNRILAGLAVARAAVQTGVVASQSFAEGGYTGDGYGSPDSSGFKQAGVVHEGEYVVPKHVLESQRGGQLVGALESMRTSRPAPFSSIGFANGGFTSAPSSVDISGLRSEISAAVSESIGAIQVINVASETVTEAVRVNNIQAEASFG